MVVAAPADPDALAADELVAAGWQPTRARIASAPTTVRTAWIRLPYATHRLHVGTGQRGPTLLHRWRGIGSGSSVLAGYLDQIAARVVQHRRRHRAHRRGL